MNKKQLITPAGYKDVSVVGLSVGSDNSTLSVEYSDNSSETLPLPAGGGSGSESDIVEVTDTVTASETYNYETHDWKSTEAGGTQNDIVTQYLPTSTHIGYEDKGNGVSELVVAQATGAIQNRSRGIYGQYRTSTTDTPSEMPSVVSGVGDIVNLSFYVTVGGQSSSSFSLTDCIGLVTDYTDSTNYEITLLSGNVLSCYSVQDVNGDNVAGTIILTPNVVNAAGTVMSTTYTFVNEIFVSPQTPTETSAAVSVSLSYSNMTKIGNVTVA